MTPTNLLFTSGPATMATEPVVISQSLLVIGVFYWLPAVLAYAATSMRDQKRRAAVLLSVMASIVLTRVVPSRPWPAFRSSLGLWEHFMRYWNVRVVGDAASLSNSSGPFLFGVCPHGIVPYSLGLMAFGRLSDFWKNPRIVIASVVKWIPLFAQVLLWGGAVEAVDSSMSAALAAGESLAVTPGGIAEMFVAGSRGSGEQAVLASRKGFVRLAIAHGATLVPVYVFGANHLFSRISLPDAITSLSRRLRASLMLFYGRWGLPIPFARPLTYAVGRAILMQKPIAGAPVNEDEVDFVHNAFVRSLRHAFQESKGTAGYSFASLDII